MKIDLTDEFFFLLGEIIHYIANDKPLAAKKFKKILITALKKDLQFPYNYKKSNYFDNEIHRDYIYKGYTITYEINDELQLVIVLGIIKNKFSY